MNLPNANYSRPHEHIEPRVIIQGSQSLSSRHFGNRLSENSNENQNVRLPPEPGHILNSNINRNKARDSSLIEIYKDTYIRGSVNNDFDGNAGATGFSGPPVGFSSNRPRRAVNNLCVTFSNINVGTNPTLNSNADD